ncbi:ankyrin, partial [Tuber magnatum]
GRTPVLWAAQSGHGSVVELLLQRGDINPDSSDVGGWTPLSYATESGHESVVKLLLERGDVNPDSPDEYGRTSELWAARSGHGSVVMLLSNERPLRLQTSPNSCLTQPISTPALRPLAEVESCPESQGEDPIPAARHCLIEPTPLSHSDEASSTQLEAPPSAPVITPTPTSDTAPDTAELEPSRPLKHRASIQPFSRSSKRKHFHSS